MIYGYLNPQYQRLILYILHHARKTTTTTDLKGALHVCYNLESLSSRNKTGEFGFESNVMSFNGFS